MKRFLSIVFFVGVVLFAGCSKEDDKRVEYSKDDVIGRWIVQSVKNPSNNEWLDITEFGDNHMWADFLSDGTYKSKEDKKQYTGTWILSGSKIICTVEDIKVNYRITEKPGNNAIFIMTYNNDMIGLTIKAVRKL